MAGKIIITFFLIIGAVLVYGASKIANKMKSENKEKTILRIKLAGFVVVIISAAFAFIKF